MTEKAAKPKTREAILIFIEGRGGRVRPVEVVQEFGLTQAMVHRHLKKLAELGAVRKEGKSPRTFYVICEEEPGESDFAVTTKTECAPESKCIDLDEGRGQSGRGKEIERMLKEELIKGI